ncbi:hypothetical protein CES86_4199 [Brucella lupini]|uniref:Uncharacterized protein n=1 Tax=Brucella lupini TaxID=255457 RepID=A0A256GFX3_9HYPH|nr:hypothetical protein CES86_4199 [Brucella lupini]
MVDPTQTLRRREFISSPRSVYAFGHRQNGSVLEHFLF